MARRCLVLGLVVCVSFVMQSAVTAQNQSLILEDFQSKDADGFPLNWEHENQRSQSKGRDAYKVQTESGVSFLAVRDAGQRIKKKKIDLVGELCANMLQESCFELNMKLRELKKGIEGIGIRPLCLSGSGSSMYCIIGKGNEGKMVNYQNKLAQKFGCKSMILNNNGW